MSDEIKTDWIKYESGSCPFPDEVVALFVIPNPAYASAIEKAHVRIGSLSDYQNPITCTLTHWSRLPKFSPPTD